MNDSRDEYWIEAVIEAFDDADVNATKEQIIDVASRMRSAHEHHGQAFYIPESTYQGEIELLKAELRKEQDKRGCMACGGRGFAETRVGASHWSPTPCDKCYGSGKT